MDEMKPVFYGSATSENVRKAQEAVEAIRNSPYTKGWDSFTPKPGEQESMTCKVCEEKMKVKRDCSGPTSFAGALSNAGVPYDFFYCENIGFDWHKQVLALRKETDNTASGAITSLLNSEIAEILETRIPTK